MNLTTDVMNLQEMQLKIYKKRSCIMKIGIDLGGSHIAIGLVQDDKIIMKKERSFLDEDRKNIKKAIKDSIIKFIEEILHEADLKLKDIELIGIAAPRNTRKKCNY